LANVGRFMGVRDMRLLILFRFVFHATLVYFITLTIIIVPV